MVLKWILKKQDVKTEIIYELCTHALRFLLVYNLTLTTEFSFCVWTIFKVVILFFWIIICDHVTKFLCSAELALNVLGLYLANGDFS